MSQPLLVKAGVYHENTAVMENLAKERNPPLFSPPKLVRAGRPVLTPAQCSLLPAPWLPTALCHLHAALSTTGCRAPGHRRWLSLGATENRELQSPCTRIPEGYTPGDMHSQDGATVLTCPYAQFPSKCAQGLKAALMAFPQSCQHTKDILGSQGSSRRVLFHPHGEYDVGTSHPVCQRQHFTHKHALPS